MCERDINLYRCNDKFIQYVIVRYHALTHFASQILRHYLPDVTNFLDFRELFSIQVLLRNTIYQSFRIFHQIVWIGRQVFLRPFLYSNSIPQILFSTPRTIWIFSLVDRRSTRGKNILAIKIQHSSVYHWWCNETYLFIFILDLFQRFFDYFIFPFIDISITYICFSLILDMYNRVSVLMIRLLIRLQQFRFSFAGLQIDAYVQTFRNGLIWLQSI